MRIGKWMLVWGILTAALFSPSPAATSGLLYRCARDFDHLLGYGLSEGAWGYWSGKHWRRPELRPQDWHYVDAEGILTNYDKAEYIRSWWEGACSVRFDEADEVNYRLWVWALDEPERDRAIVVTTSLDDTPRYAADKDYEGWYDCGVVSMEPGAQVSIRKANVEKPTAWALVKAVYLTQERTTEPPRFHADAHDVPERLRPYRYPASLPLDHDWILQWSEVRSEHPRVAIKASEVDRFRRACLRPELTPIRDSILNTARRYKWKPETALWMNGNQTQWPKGVTLALAFLITGESEYAEHAKNEMLAHMRQHALAFGRRPPSGEEWDRGNVTLAKFFRHSLLVYDLIESSGVMSRTEDCEARALFASLAYYLEKHPDGRWEEYMETGRGYWWWNGNTDRYTAVGLCGLLFPGHPRSRVWIDHAAESFAKQMEGNVLPGGTWPESSNYALVTLSALTTFLGAYENATDEMLLDDSSVKGLFNWLVETSSAPVPTWWRDVLRPALPNGGFSARMLENWLHLRPTARLAQGTGESAWNNGYTSVLASGAALWCDRDPAFAGRLKWAWQEWGGQLVSDGETIMGMTVAPRLFDVTSSPQTLKSARLDGYVVCRDRFSVPGEELELFVDAQLKRSHGYPDFGQYQLYAYGAPVTKDFDLNGVRDHYKTENWNVPWDTSVDRYAWNYSTDEVCRTLPNTLTESDVFFTIGADGVRVDYGLAKAPGLYRNYLLVKSGPAAFAGVPYLVVLDDCNDSRQLYQCCYAVATDVTRSGNMFRFHGYWGVDYEVHYLVPRLSGGGDWLEPWMREREIEVLQGRPDVGMKGRNRLEKIPPDGDWLWIGYPRRLDMGDLVATVLSDSADSGQVRRVDVSVGNTRDVVLLATQRASYANDDISFDGTFGVLRCEESRGWSALTCLGGGYLTYGELSVAYPGGSVSLVFAETSITGDVSGPGGTVHCAYPAVAGKRCRMSVGHDRRDLRPSVGSLDVPVPPGRHTFSIVWEGEP